jgi:hypothetical protein
MDLLYSWLFEEEDSFMLAEMQASNLVYIMKTITIVCNDPHQFKFILWFEYSWRGRME